ncbi:MAG: DNA starvation/stationary phase protection protein [Thermoleophilia bacterium]
MPPRNRNAKSGQFTVPGLSEAKGRRAAELLQQRLVSLLDLGMTLKHVHWNVVGPDFIGVHEMLDPQHAAVQVMVDATAERIATLGGSPNGLPGGIVETRDWDDYDLGRASTLEHLGALDMVYVGVIGDHRAVIDEMEKTDPVSHDMLIGQTGELEQFHWFIRAHLESREGALSTAGETTEQGAAKKARSAKRS